MTPAEKMLLDQMDKKLDKLFKYIDELKSDSAEIKIQTTKTNGRVNHLEETQRNCPVKDLQKETEVIRVLSKNNGIAKSYVIGLIVLNVGTISGIVYTLIKLSGK